MSQRQTDYQNTKKFGKLKTTVQEFDHVRPGNSYKQHPDCEPLLNHELSTSSSHIYRNGRHHLSSLDQQNSPRGITSVTEIKFTMGDDYHPNLPSAASPINILPVPDIPKPDSPCCSLVRCTKVSCDENSCLWHRCVLKLPQHVRWEDRTVTIELERKDNESFGFHHKSKQHIGKDEIYTLVSHVAEDSKAAKSGLALGDLILSANNVPMQTKQKPSEFNFKKQNKLRLLIQHPLQISSKAAGHVEQLMVSMAKIREQNSTSNHVQLSQPLSPSESPTDPPGLSPYEIIKLFPIAKPETNDAMRLHQLPQVRIFVCGSAAKEFTQFLIGDFINNFHDDRARCFEISMKKSENGNVTISNSESFSYLFKNPSESCVNVELVSVSNNRFFHHCCPWMFTPNSIFILTFDTRRLSHSSEVELSHLRSLAHTVQTNIPGAYSNIRLYGIASGGESVYPEEIQTLFYASRMKSLPDPKIVSLSKGVMCEDMKHIRLDIFSMFWKACERQQVAFPAAVALDMLVSHRGLTTTLDDLAKTLENWSSDSKQLGRESLYRVVEDLRNTGNLLVTGSMNAACNSESEKKFVLPCVLFDQLSCLAQCTEKERVPLRQQNTWLTLCSSGIVTRPEFLDILNVCTLEPEKVLACMVDLYMVFPVKSSGEDSGFGDMGSVLFPFFMEDVPFSDFQQADNYDAYMTIEFSADVAVSSFFSLLSALSQSDSCRSFRMGAQFVGQLVLHGLDICLYFLKTSRQINIFKNRSNRLVQYESNLTVIQLIQQSVSQQIASTVKVKVTIHPQEKIINGPSDIKASGVTPQERVVCVPIGQSEASALPNVPISPEQVVDAIGIAAAVPDCSPPAELSEDERATQRVLEMDMQNLRFIRRELRTIYCYLSQHDTLQDLVCELELSTSDWLVYEAVIRNSSSKLPAEVVLESYFQENIVSLQDFVQILVRLKEKRHARLEDMVNDLMAAALSGNK